MTKKQEKFVEAYVETGGNGTQAAMQAYGVDDPNTAAVMAYENLRKPKIREALDTAFPDDYLHKIHREGLHATKGVYKQTGEYTWAKVDEVPDHQVIHKFLDTAYKLKGSYAGEKHAHVHVHVEPSDRIKRLTQKLNA